MPRCYRYFVSAAPRQGDDDQPPPDDKGKGDKGDAGKGGKDDEGKGNKGDIPLLPPPASEGPPRSRSPSSESAAPVARPEPFFAPRGVATRNFGDQAG